MSTSEADADRLTLIAEILRSLPPADRTAMLAELSAADRLVIVRLLLSTR